MCIHETAMYMNVVCEYSYLGIIVYAEGGRWGSIFLKRVEVLTL